jgi:hypothetical protein
MDQEMPWPAGKGSFRVAPAAVPPLLLTATVKPMGLPAFTSAASGDFLTVRFGGLGGTTGGGPGGEDSVAVGVGVAVFVGVAVGVEVGVAVAVGVAVLVGVAVFVGVGAGVFVGATVGVAVAVGVAVLAGTSVLVGVAVGVSVGAGGGGDEGFGANPSALTV